MRRRICLLLPAVIGFLAATSYSTGPSAPRLLSPSEMKPVYQPPTFPGGEGVWLEGDIRAAAPYTVRITLPADYRVPPRVHPSLTHMLITSGSLEVGTGSTYDPAVLKKLPAGSYIELPANAPYFFHTTENTTYFIYGIGPWSVTYVDPSEDPRKNRKIQPSGARSNSP